MQLHFEPNLQNESSEAIAATVRVFEGAPYTRPKKQISWKNLVSL